MPSQRVVNVPLEWKGHIDGIFSLWNDDKKEIEEFIVLANRHHPTIKFTAEISDKKINFLDITATFQYTHFFSCHPPGVGKGFIKGEALRLLRTNSSAKSFVEIITQFKTRLRARDYPNSLVERTRNSEEFTGGAVSQPPPPFPFLKEKRFNFSSSWFPVTCYGQFALPVC